MSFTFCPFCAAKWDSVQSLWNTRSHKCLQCKVVLNVCVYLNEPLVYSLPPSLWHLHLASQTLPASQQILCLYVAVSAVARARIAFKQLTIPSVRFMRSSSTPPLITTTSPVSFFRRILNIKVTAKNILHPSLHILRGVTGGERVSKNNRWGHEQRQGSAGLWRCCGTGMTVEENHMRFSRFKLLPYIDLWDR